MFVFVIDHVIIVCLQVKIPAREKKKIVLTWYLCFCWLTKTSYFPTVTNKSYWWKTNKRKTPTIARVIVG